MSTHPLRSAYACWSEALLARARKPSSADGICSSEPASSAADAAAAVPQRAALPARLARCLAGSFFFAKVGILRNTSPQPCEHANRAVVERVIVARAQRLGAIRGPE